MADGDVPGITKPGMNFVEETPSSPKTPRRRRSRSPAPQTPKSRGRSRSPSRRQSIRRSPSPHRYNTRNNQMQSGGETSAEGVFATTKRLSLKVVGWVKQYQSLGLELCKCIAALAVILIAVTLCSKQKCQFQLPKEIPDPMKLLGLYDEAVFLKSVTSYLFFALIFLVPIGQVVEGLPLAHGKYSYLCNGPAVLLLCLVLQYFGHKHYGVLVSETGNPLQTLAHSCIVILLIALCAQWKFKSLGFVYNTSLIVVCCSMVDARFHLTHLTPQHYTAALLVFSMVLSFIALIHAFLNDPNDLAITSASRGFFVLCVTWTLRHDVFPIPDLECFINTAVWMNVINVAFILVGLSIKHSECLKVCGVLIAVIGVVSGALVQQDYLKIPTEVPYLSLWYVVNLASGTDTLFVIARANWKTNFFGVNPLHFLSDVLIGSPNPRINLFPPLLTFDVKFFCIRLGLLCPMLYSVQIGLDQFYSGEYLPLNVTAVLVMTGLYLASKLISLEKTHVSSTDIVDKKCGIGFMLWTICAQPALLLIPLRYLTSGSAVTSPIDDSVTSSSYLLTALLCSTFVMGLLVYTYSTLQGHYLITGENHPVTRCLTTIAAAGNERIPVSGLWRFMKYPSITGELMILASIALACGLDEPLVFLPFLVHLVHSVKRVVSYNKLSPAFYGIRAWKSYQDMVKYNVIPGVW